MPTASVEVVSVAVVTPPDVATEELPIGYGPSKNVTVPVGGALPYSAVTVAVSVTDCP